MHVHIIKHMARFALVVKDAFINARGHEVTTRTGLVGLRACSVLARTHTRRDGRTYRYRYRYRR